MRLSGSRYHLAVVCSYPFHPDVEVEDRPAGQAARIGTAVHGMVDAYVRGLPEPEYHEALEAAPIARRVISWLDTQPRPHSSEIAIAYDPTTDTARELEVTSHRAYGELAPTEIPTTLDLLWLEDDAVIIRDLKTGAKGSAHVEQLHIQALAATRLLCVPRARVGFLWGRKTKCEADALEELGPGELEVESWRASSIVRRLPVAQPTPGDHCRRYWCPAFTSCPAHQAPTETDRNEATA